MLHSFIRCLLASLIVEALLYERDSLFRNEAVIIERWELFLQGQNQYSSEAFSESFESPSFQKIRYRHLQIHTRRTAETELRALNLNLVRVPRRL